jgi:type VI secretion system protein ImpA
MTVMSQKTRAIAPAPRGANTHDLPRENPDVLAAFDQALASTAVIEQWCAEYLGSFAPDLSAVGRLSRLLAHTRSQQRAAGQEIVPACETAITGESLPPSAGAPEKNEATWSSGGAQRVAGAPLSLSDRQAPLDSIRQARLWFETHEPSSPISVLLRRAEQLVGKRYAEVVLAIPAELLAQWDVSVTGQ